MLRAIRFRSPDKFNWVDGHAAFAAAGADIVTTASYQLSTRAGLSGAEVRRLAAVSVDIARRAVAGASLVAGSVGPFGAALGDGSEYTGDYRLTTDEFAAFHRPRIEALADSGADVIALETQPNLAEIRVLADLAAEVCVPAWLSVTLADGHETAPRLPDGAALTAIAEVACAHPIIRALGVNCVRPAQVSSVLEALATGTDLPLLAYPNSGETYDAETMEWRPAAEPDDRLGAWPVDHWIDQGARILGGCCRTTPDDIAALRQSLAAPSRD